MEYKRLVDICVPKQWKTLSGKELVADGKYDVYGANGVIGKYNEYNHSKDTVVIGCRGTCGKDSVRIVPKYSYINGNSMCFDDLSNDYELKFFYYFLKSLDYTRIITGIAQPQITIKSLEKVFVPVISKVSQNQIVSILDKINEIIGADKKQLELLDEAVRTRFIEMFGDLKKFVRLGDCCEVHARIGWQSLTTAEHMLVGDYLLITGTDFKDNEIDYSSCKYVTKQRYDMDEHIMLKNNDVLITKDGTIGKVAIVHNLPKPATLNSGVFVVRPNQLFDKEYIAYVFKGPLFSEFVEKSKTGATIKHLNQKHLVEFNIPLPSIEKQEEFSKFSQSIAISKFNIQKHMKLMQELLDKKMDEYFGGNE